MTKEVPITFRTSPKVKKDFKELQTAVFKHRGTKLTYETVFIFGLNAITHEEDSYNKQKIRDLIIEKKKAELEVEMIDAEIKELSDGVYSDDLKPKADGSAGYDELTLFVNLEKEYKEFIKDPKHKYDTVSNFIEARYSVFENVYFENRIMKSADRKNFEKRFKIYMSNQ